MIRKKVRIAQKELELTSRMRSGEDLKRHFNIEFNLILKSNSIMATVTKDKGTMKKVYKKSGQITVCTMYT